MTDGACILVPFWLADECGILSSFTEEFCDMRGITLTAGLTMFLVAGSAGAASFDCNKAATPTEYAICDAPALSDLDVAMATLYSVRLQVPMLMGARGAVQDDQHAFLQQRNACGADESCITAAYQARIAALNSEIAVAMHDYCIRLGICG